MSWLIEELKEIDAEYYGVVDAATLMALRVAAIYENGYRQGLLYEEIKDSLICQFCQK